MKYLQLVPVIVLLLMTGSCRNFGKRVKGNGNRITQSRDVSDASRIRVAGDFDVVLSKGETSVKLEGDENLLEYVTTDVDGGSLKLGTRSNTNLQSDRPIKIYISTPDLELVSMSGSGNVTSADKFISTSKIAFSVSGSGNITLTVNTPAVSASIAGSGNINLGGETKDVDVSIAGSGNLNAFDLKAEQTKVSIAGSGNAYVYSDVNIYVSIAGSGEVEYKGNASVRKKIAGSGSITKR